MSLVFNPSHKPQWTCRKQAYRENCENCENSLGTWRRFEPSAEYEVTGKISQDFCGKGGMQRLMFCGIKTWAESMASNILLSRHSQRGCLLLPALHHLHPHYNFSATVRYCAYIALCHFAAFAALCYTNYLWNECYIMSLMSHWLLIGQLSQATALIPSRRKTWPRSNACSAKKTSVMIWLELKPSWSLMGLSSQAS